jgi:hypothetical protein
MTREQHEALADSAITADQVRLPIFIRLTDVAKTPEEIEKAVACLIQRDYRDVIARHLNPDNEGSDPDVGNGLLTWADAEIKRWVDWLLTWADAEIKHWVDARVRSGHCCLLLDALDETLLEADPGRPEPGFRNELYERLRRFAERHPHCPILLTSRIVGYTEPPFPLANTNEQRELELVAFDRDQQSQFVRAWFHEPPDAANRLLHKLRQTASIRGLAQIPLLLGLICKLYREDNTLPDRRVELYEKCLNRMLRGVWKESPRIQSDGYLNEKRRLVEHVAYAFFTDGKEVLNYDRLLGCIEKHLSEKPSSILAKKGASVTLDELSEGDGLFVKAGAGDNPPYLFLHLTFMEYLAACALARRDDWLEIALTHVYDPSWQEVLRLLGGVLEDRVETYIKRLLQENRNDLLCRPLELAARALGEAPEEARGRALSEGLLKLVMDMYFDTSPWLDHNLIRRLLTGWGTCAVEPLLQTFQEEDSYVRRTAAEALGQIGDARAVEPLIQYLNDEDKDIRRAAAGALGQIGDARAVELLIQRLQDKDWFVLSNAAAVLRSLAQRHQQATPATSAPEPMRAWLENFNKSLEILIQSG